jgi:hypothetical protein
MDTICMNKPESNATTDFTKMFLIGTPTGGFAVDCARGYNFGKHLIT